MSPSHCRISWDGGFVLYLTFIYGGVSLLEFLRQAEDRSEEQARLLKEQIQNSSGERNSLSIPVDMN